MTNNDITIRAEEYLNNMSVKYHNEGEKEDGSNFYLTGRKLGILEEQALHLWVIRQTKGSLSIPYSRLKAVCQQIEQYPERTQWKMNIGFGWDVTRNGEILFLTKCDETNNNNSTNYNTWKIYKKDDESINDDRSEVHFVDITLSDDLLNDIESGCHDFVVKTVADNEFLTFLPPWRPSTSKPKKIKEFLRGQKIPLHRRHEIPLLCLHDDSNREDHIVAVYIGNTEKSEICTQKKDRNEGTWVVNSKFDRNSIDGNKYTVILVKC